MSDAGRTLALAGPSDFALHAANIIEAERLASAIVTALGLVRYYAAAFMTGASRVMVAPTKVS